MAVPEFLSPGAAFPAVGKPGLVSVHLCHSRSLVLCGKNGVTSFLSFLEVVWGLVFQGDDCAGGQSELGNLLKKRSNHRIIKCPGVGRDFNDGLVPNSPAMGRDTCC